MGSSLNHVTILDHSAEWLKGRERNDTSQFGEDGLIEAVFERIGTTNEWCFEVGASDGELFSNTKRLRDAGWRAVLIEADETLYGKCRKFAGDAVRVVRAKVGAESIDKILAGKGCPIQFDMGVIDIDGRDYWVWKELETFRPRVMLIEYGYANEPDFIPDYELDDMNKQAGLAAIVKLGEEKGYIAVLRTLCNVLFVDRATWEKTCPTI